MPDKARTRDPVRANDDDSHIIATVGRDDDDDRDLLFSVSESVVASLPLSVDRSEYAHYVHETWHQRGLECTGFALAAIANFIFRKQLDDPGLPSVSRRMLYEMAQLNDDRDLRVGSTPRGALKGWKSVGVASDELWPYDPGDEDGRVHGRLTLARLLDARNRPLLRYRRIPDGSIDIMRAAIAQGHALFASSDTHGGWYRLFLSDVEPVIRRRDHHKMAGDHAFVIAGYDETGFWVHNSWGPEWGHEGYALLPYDEWDEFKSSAWVVEAALSGPSQRHATVGGRGLPADRSVIDNYRDMWQHLVVLRDDGLLSASGLYEMDQGSVRTLLFLFQEHTIDWDRRRLAIFVDGGCSETADTIARLRPRRDQLLQAGIYPIFVVWETAWFAELRQEMDALDPGSAVGPVIRQAWELIVERSQRACRASAGGARHLAEAVEFKRNQKPFDLHVIAHGAGDLLLTELIAMLPTPVTSATLLASASPLQALHDVYGAMLADGRLQHLNVLNLDANTETADSFGSFTGSLLELVSNLLAVPPSGGSLRPMLGLQRDLAVDADARRLGSSGLLDLDAVAGSSHLDLPFDTGVWTRMIERLVAHETPHLEPPPDAVAELPRDPLARARALQHRVDRQA